MNHWHKRAEITLLRLILWIGISNSKHANWKDRYGKANEHNCMVPRDHWLAEEEREKILQFGREHSLDGYRRCAYMMIDANVVAASPATVYRVMKEGGLIGRRTTAPSRKGTGFDQPLRPHQHWHIDISYINICGTFYYLCSLLDGYSRFIVHWELREQMKERDVEVIVQRARERFESARPRIISDNGPQFIARDFKEFIRISGMTHVRTSPYYPQSNGKIERWHKTLKTTCIRPKAPLSLEDALRTVGEFVEHYNNERLHSAIAYVTPIDKLEGRAPTVLKERDHKLEAAREARKQRRAQVRQLSANQAAGNGPDATRNAELSISP